MINSNMVNCYCCGNSREHEGSAKISRKNFRPRSLPQRQTGKDRMCFNVDETELAYGAGIDLRTLVEGETRKRGKNKQRSSTRPHRRSQTKAACGRTKAGATEERHAA